MQKKIRITCSGVKDHLPLSELKIIQGNLKELSEESAVNLQSSIEKYGFFAPLFIWVSGKKKKSYNILDDTQRKATEEYFRIFTDYLTKMGNECEDAKIWMELEKQKLVDAVNMAMKGIRLDLFLDGE